MTKIYRPYDNLGTTYMMIKDKTKTHYTLEFILLYFQCWLSFPPFILHVSTCYRDMLRLKEQE